MGTQKESNKDQTTAEERAVAEKEELRRLVEELGEARKRQRVMSSEELQAQFHRKTGQNSESKKFLLD
jgi:hypothetical protein